MVPGRKAEEHVTDTCRPARAWHGTMDPSPLADGMPAAATCHWFVRARWDRHDRWMAGGPHLEEGIPYANIVWEALGLRDRATSPMDVAPWAVSIRTHDALAKAVGMMFVTDDPRDAARYGTPIEVDLDDPAILSIIDDPHVRTHAGWILLIATGQGVPFRSD